MVVHVVYRTRAGGSEVSGSSIQPMLHFLEPRPHRPAPLREGTFFFLYRRAFICGPESTGHMVSAQKTVTAVTTVEESFKEKRNEWIKGVRD